MQSYAPLDTLKPLARDIWIIDGQAIHFYAMPFSTRATVVRLSGGDIWVHSPTRLSADLATEVAALGPVAHLVAPNWLHYAHMARWQARFPKARSWAAPGVRARAESRGVALKFDADLEDTAPPGWRGEIDQMIVQGSRIHREAVFFHHKSKTLILTDLIENFEPGHLKWWMVALAWLAGILDPDGQMPRDMRATFRRHRHQLRAAVEQMIAWRPERIILAHGRCYETAATDELRRAFRFVLR
jgi:Domain of unknown function (DUF4336)